MTHANEKFVFVRTGGIEAARYGIKGTVECKLSEPLGIEYCVAYLKSRDIPTAIVDFFLFHDEDSAIKEICDMDPLCIGFSILYSDMLIGSYRAIEKLRELGYRGHVTIGGTYPTLSAKYVMDNFPLIDSIVMVEGEVTCAELALALKNKNDLSTVDGLVYRGNGRIVHNQSRPLCNCLDDLPHPDRERFSDYIERGGIIQIHSSRGCHKNCKFCGTAAFYRHTTGNKWRCRSARHVIEELLPLLSRTSNREVWMTDDNFIGQGDKGNARAIEIANLLVANDADVKLVIQSRADNLRRETLRALKMAGLLKIYIGVESGNDSSLSFYGKGTTPDQNYNALKLLESEEIFGELGYIGFNPHTTLGDFEENIAFLKSVAGESGFIHPFAFDMLIPYRGTPLAKILLSEGLAEPDGLDYKSIIRDQKVLRAWQAVNHLIILFGPATERVKYLITEEGLREDANAAILNKNRALFVALDHILGTVKSDKSINVENLYFHLKGVANDLNSALGI